MEHLRLGIGITEGRGGAYADQLFSSAMEAIAQAADQTGQVGALGAIEGVEFIHHQITKNPLSVVGPEPLHMGLEQQVVELLVVGEEKVGRCLVQGVAIGDDLLGTHGDGALLLLVADVEAGP